jgi:hypothetical protein
MDDVKRGYREAENKAREAGREMDGHDLSDDIGNAGDDIRKDLGNAGDAMRRGAEDVADRADDEADRRF